MAETSVKDFTSLINKQVELLENLNGYLSKMESLVNIALGVDFLDYSESTLHDYFWIMDDVIKLTKRMSGEGIDALLKVLRPGLDKVETD